MPLLFCTGKNTEIKNKKINWLYNLISIEIFFNKSENKYKTKKSVYLLQSFQSELPWSECPNRYFQNGSYAIEPECQLSGPTQYFWYRTTLMISKDINSPEVFNWKIAMALVVAWILVYMCMIKGIASSGKVFKFIIFTLKIFLSFKKLIIS